MKVEREIRDNVLLIRAGDGFIPDGIRSENYSVEKPYYEKGLIFRLLRELFFRLNLPFKELFYNKAVLDFSGEYIIVYDPQITKDYLKWLLDQNKWNISLFYGNIIGKARHVLPEDVPKGINKWTYNRSESELYGMNYIDQLAYCRSFCVPKAEPIYDVMFVGKDKGRIDFVCELEKQLIASDRKTFFRIVGNTRFSKKKDPRYGMEMSYKDICEVISKSKAILNITFPGQDGLTVRDCEAICNNVKLITTNKHIVNESFYNANNILVIDDVDVDKINQFLELPFITYSDEIQESISFEKWVKTIVFHTHL